MMKKTDYGYSVRTDLSYDAAIRRVTEALQAEGFGILTEIDVKATMKKKLDLDFRRYVILGACSPKDAARMLDADIEIGLLMPCNVIVYENDAGGATVSFLSPNAQFRLTGRPELGAAAEDVDARIRRVAASL